MGLLGQCRNAQIHASNSGNDQKRDIAKIDAPTILILQIDFAEKYGIDSAWTIPEMAMEMATV